MKKILSLLVMVSMLLTVMPGVFAWGTGGTVGGNVDVETEMYLFKCSNHVMTDEAIQPWRNSTDGEFLGERVGNYLFDGEKYSVDVLVYDKNKVDDVLVDLLLEVDDDYEVNCHPIGCPTNTTATDIEECNVRVDQQTITACDSNLMEMYRCTIEATSEMTGEGWLSVMAENQHTGTTAIYDEIVPLFLNPMVALSISDALDFGDNILPGRAYYSNTVITNEGDGGVPLDLFITGSDWESTGTTVSECRDVSDVGVWDAGGALVNHIPIGAFRYFAQKGAYSSLDDALFSDNNYDGIVRTGLWRDVEGYMNMHKLLNSGFEETMFDDAEILQAGGPVFAGFGYKANVIYPDETGMAMTFKLEMPVPCYGNYDGSDAVQIWGEAI